ncbi:MAG TPA: ABC transporter substrate-binding protein [Bryobacteraceae bacterium]|jgi:iron complex transport system substrate-binding protein
MRIVSLLASATEIVDALGATSQLVGRSHECDNPPSVRALPECSSPAFDIHVSSRAIDTEVNRRLRAGEPLYVIHSALIESLQPDLILTQEHCEVCAVTPADLSRSGYDLAQARTVALSAFTLEDIFDNITRIALALDLTPRGGELVADLRARLEAVRQSTAPLPRPTVAVLEWTDPFFVLGNWGPELVDIAGGEPVLSNRHAHSVAISPELLGEADPEYIVIAPCGFTLDRAWQDRAVLEALPWWPTLRAVRENKVAFADGNRLFNRSGITVADTAELLAEILHRRARAPQPSPIAPSPDHRPKPSRDSNGAAAHPAHPTPAQTPNPLAEIHDFRWYTEARVRES